MRNFANCSRVQEQANAERPAANQLLPAEGLEPTRPCGHWILSPARLPIPPRRLHSEARLYEATLRFAFLFILSHCLAINTQKYLKKWQQMATVRRHERRKHSSQIQR